MTSVVAEHWFMARIEHSLHLIWALAVITQPHTAWAAPPLSSISRGLGQCWSQTTPTPPPTSHSSPPGEQCQSAPAQVAVLTDPSCLRHSQVYLNWSIFKPSIGQLKANLPFSPWLRSGHIYSHSCLALTHWGRVTHICVNKLTIMVQIMACRLAGAKPLSEPMLEYC